MRGLATPITVRALPPFDKGAWSSVVAFWQEHGRTPDAAEIAIEPAYYRAALAYLAAYRSGSRFLDDVRKSYVSRVGWAQPITEKQAAAVLKLGIDHRPEPPFSLAARPEANPSLPSVTGQAPSGGHRDDQRA